MFKTPSLWLPVLLAAFCTASVSASDLPAANPDLAAKVKALPESDLIIYSPDTAKHQVTVFTDVNCPFCRRLHTQMDDYLLFDIEIRYAAFPYIDNALDQMHAVWCSDDRKAAMTRAKRSEIIEAPACDNPVDGQLDIALEFRFMGTPAIVTPQGRVLYGQIGADRLLETLEKEAAGAKP